VPASVRGSISRSRRLRARGWGSGDWNRVRRTWWFFSSSKSDDLSVLKKIKTDHNRFWKIFISIAIGFEKNKNRSWLGLKIKKSGAGKIVRSDVNERLMNGLIGFKIFTNRSKPVLKKIKTDHDRVWKFFISILIGLSKS
jgi:hypothetical protein